MRDYNKRISLSDVDKKILKVLLTPNGGRYSSKSLAKKLGIPATTVQRHRRRLEEVLTVINIFDISRFGWHKVDFLIATERGKTESIGKSLLKLDEVIYVGKSIGEHTIDLRVETVLKDNAEILRMIELLKAMEGVRDVMWTEIVKVVGRKTSTPIHVIDQL